MFRISNQTRSLYGLYRSFQSRLSQRTQSTTSTPKVTLEPNTSNMSIFSGHIKGGITNNLEFIRPENLTPIPLYQVLDAEGKVKDESQTPDVCEEILKKISFEFLAQYI